MVDTDLIPRISEILAFIGIGGIIGGILTHFFEGYFAHHFELRSLERAHKQRIVEKMTEKLHEYTENYYMALVSYSYSLAEHLKKISQSFSWDEVPGNDSGRLVEFLKQKFGISWVETAKIEKIDDGRTIRVTDGKNYLSLGLNNEKTKVNLKIDDDRSAEFIAKSENGKLNIYSQSDFNDDELRETFHYLALFLSQRSYMYSKIHGIFLKDLSSEAVIPFILDKKIFDFFKESKSLSKADLSKLAEETDPNETFFDFSVKLDNQLSTTFKKFNNWINEERSDCSELCDYLNCFSDLLLYEINEPYGAWYGGKASYFPPDDLKILKRIIT